MKIRLCAALLIALMSLLMLTGCAVQAAEARLERVEEAVERRLDNAEDAVEAAIIQAVIPEAAAAPTRAPEPAPTQPAEPEPVQPSVPAVTEAAKQLTGEEAEAIALQHAGFTAGQVNYLRSQYEIDDRIPQYDVEFHEGRWEYEYEIHAETGAVLSFDKDD